MPEFHGTIDDLKAGVAAAGLEGTWSERPNYCWKFTSKNRGGLNWASSTGKIWFDGPDDPKRQLSDAVEAALGVGLRRPRIIVPSLWCTGMTRSLASS
jgi:hypothetical protein